MTDGPPSTSECDADECLGKPPRWSPPKEQQPLKEDDPNGTYYRDPNAAAFPQHPIEPAVVCIIKTHQQPLSPGLQLVACASTLGNLLRFAQRSSDKPFRFLVEVIGDVVHFVRREKTPTAQIFGVRGFGHTFPEANTTWEADVAGSKSHQRILRYKLGGIDTMIRFEVDGYLPVTDDSPVSDRGSGSSGSDDDVEIMLDRLKVALQPKTSIDAPVDLVVRQGGEIIPHDRAFDLKTRGHYAVKHEIVNQELPRLWLRQMEHFIVAFHKKHVFEDITVNNIKKKVNQWERREQALLGSTLELLRAIMDQVRAQKDGRLEVVYTGEGPLELRTQLADAGDMLSEKTREEWKVWLGGSYGRDDGENEGAVKVAGADDGDDNWDSDSEAGDLTACSKECGFCGRCNY